MPTASLPARTDFKDNVTTYIHNERGLETSRTEAAGTAQARTTSTDWHPQFRLPTKITEAHRVTTFVYDAKGNLLIRTVTPTVGTARTWLYNYNSNSQLIKTDGPLPGSTDVTTYTHDAQGNLTSITNALKHVIQITASDANGRPLTIQDANGLVTQLAYNFRGQITSRDVGGEITKYKYDLFGQISQLKQVTKPSGGVINFTYDNAHRLIGVSDELGNRIAYTLDAEGNRIKTEVFDPLNALALTRASEFDSLNRLAKSIGALSQQTTYQYDANDNLTGLTDPLLNTTTNSYDALNRLVSSTDPGNAVTHFDYNANDELTQVIDANGLATQYGYSDLGDLTKLTSPDTGITSKTYNAAGNVVTSTDARGKITRYSYDLLNRLIKRGVITYAYDNGINAKGRLTSITDSTGSTSYAYDLHGRVVNKTQAIGTLSLVTQYVYDAVGRLSAMTYPSGAIINFSYDKDRLIAFKRGTEVLLSNIKYSAFGEVSNWLWGNGQAYQRQFDQDGRLTSYPLGNVAMTLGYDDAGRIKSYASTDAALNQQFSYDALGRLTTVTAQPGQSLTYDAIGNRTSHIKANVSSLYNYKPNTNHLSQISNTPGIATAYSYDASGSMVFDGIRRFVYDPQGRLVKSRRSGIITSYGINGLGQRVSKTTGTNATLFAYDEAGHLIGEYDGTGAAIQETVFLDDMPVTVLKPAASYPVFADQINTPRAIANASGTVIWQWGGDPFGHNHAERRPR